MNVYLSQGYANRNDYLGQLARSLDLDVGTVKAIADLLGPNEDFDGLLTQLEEFAENVSLSNQEQVKK